MTRLDKIPLAETRLEPTRAFYIHGGGLLKTFTITDITESTEVSAFLTTTDLTHLIAKAKSDAATKAVSIQLDKPSVFSTAITARDPSGALVATISGAVLTLGRQTITYAVGSSHHHPIKLSPVHPASRADEFVIESVPFLWDVVDGRRRCELTKVLDGTRVEVGRFVAESPRDKSGVLLVDSREIDEILAALTCVAVLNRMDSFRF